MKKSRGFTGSEGEGLEKVELKTVGDPLDETGVKVNESSHHLRTREVNCVELGQTETIRSVVRDWDRAKWSRRVGG